MRIVFIGSVKFSQSALEKLIALNANIVGVCTLQKSAFNSDHCDLSKVCIDHRIPCIYAEDINSENILNWIRLRQPHIIFCFGWSKLLKGSLLTIAPLGVIGFHPSALPENRGRHPLIWALVLGLTKTATTFFFMDEGADSGDIISQYDILIEPQEDATSLYNKMTSTALSQIENFLPHLINGNYKRKKQNHQLANTWRKRTYIDGKIDWRMTAESIHNLIKALTCPYGGAHFLYGNEDIKVWKSAIIEDDRLNLEPGQVVGYKNFFPVIKCGEKSICLIDVTPSFKPNIGDYL